MSDSKPGVLVTDPRVMSFAAALAEEFHVIDAADTALLDREAGNVVAIIAAGVEPIGPVLLDRLPGLRLIAAAATGIDGIDTAAAAVRGIAVTNAGSLHANDVADHAVVMTLAARQRMLEGDAWVRGGRWSGEGMMPVRHSLASEKIGIVGMGTIGRSVAEKIAAFCPDIGWWAPRPQDLRWPRHESLLALARWSSILILCARGDPENGGLIDAETIDAIGPRGLFMNIARGHLVDEDALVDALRAGRLGQAALDVFAEEPADPARWAGVPNVLLSPHAAGITIETAVARREVIAGNIRALLTGGELRNIVVEGRASQIA
jgi:hydroxypyruvate reductase